MSHSHSHGPGEDHNHSHGPPLTPLTPQTPISAQLPRPDPAVQALIDQDFKPSPIKIGAEPHIVVCTEHAQEKCSDCNLDLTTLNRMSRIFANNPNLPYPPPANVITQKLTQMVTATKEEGNALFKKGQHQLSIQRYSTAAVYAVQRPPWEANQLMREELSTVISNRSAAFYESHDYISALADAEVVLQLRRNWGKGHFRKAKALQALGQIADACEAIRLGLSFEPGNQELTSVLVDLEKQQKEGKKPNTKSEQAQPSEVPATA
ncbi:hypothetical protein F5887DRAFT_1110368 [Amanita rubescens]|nr:hypothetical protein F5887DRAFT_1166709 [Amanita rubescens]KAF8330545.1 hypothetical protein F5887DRAFT_1110368 [Amanita rubescens]